MFTRRHLIKAAGAGLALTGSGLELGSARAAGALVDLPTALPEGARNNAMLDSLPGKVEALAALLEPLADHPHVGEVRQRGLMVGIELVADRATKEPFPERLQVGAEVARATRPRGAIVRPLGDVVVLMPPLSISDDELRRLVAITGESIAAVTSSQVRTPAAA